MDVDISMCVLVFLIENPLVQEFKAQKFQMKTQISIFLSWLLSRMLQLVNTGACRQLGLFPAPCWRRACSDKLPLSFLQQHKSSVSPRVKARLFAGRGPVELVKSPFAGWSQFSETTGQWRRKYTPSYLSEQFSTTLMSRYKSSVWRKWPNKR